ncbi:MAG: PilZ domain-containing protein [Actinomycetota bacterium]
MAARISVRPELEQGSMVLVAPAGTGADATEAVVAAGGKEPVIRAKGLRLSAGQTVSLSYSTGAAVVEFAATVSDASDGQAALTLPESADRIQRRDFARIFVELPMILLVQRPNGRPAIQRGTTVDVSAGGAAIRMTTKIAEGSDVPFLLHCDREVQVTGVAHLIGSDPHRRTQYRHRLRFDQVRPADRDALAAWVFRQQMPR